MPNVSLSIPNALGVSAMILYFGLSSGWHIGKAMTAYNEQRKEGTARKVLLRRFFWKATHHYDLGVGLATVGAALLMPEPALAVGSGWLLLGFGFGMAYDDRADHPPEGMLTYFVRQIRSLGSNERASAQDLRHAPEGEGNDGK
ncbi:MAG: hypothetical protein SXQ77_07560 [Halobacteria archaeon]|nr:hypothetical protein [Halobacteria archaeon]